MKLIGNKRKAQVSIEFLLIIAFVIALFTILMATFGERLYNIQTDHQRERLEHVIKVITDELKVASTCEDGYSKTIKISKNQLGTDYNMTIEGQRLLAISIPYVQERYEVLANNTLVDTVGYINTTDNPAAMDFSNSYIDLKIEKMNQVVTITSCTKCIYSYYDCYVNNCTALTAMNGGTHPGILAECRDRQGKDC